MIKTNKIELLTDKYTNVEYETGLSIPLTFYNESPYMIEHCLNSLFAQTFMNIELIIINDGPQNEWVEETIFKTLASNIGDNIMCLKYYRNNDNRGAAWSKNFGLSKCTQKYIMQFDGDFEILDTEYISGCVDFLEHNNDYFCVCGDLVYQFKPGGGSFIIGCTSAYEDDLGFICQAYAPPMHVMLRKEALSGIEYRDCIQFDGDFWLNVFYKNRESKFKHISFPTHYGVFFEDLQLNVAVVDNRRPYDENDPYAPKVTGEVSKRFHDIGIEYGTFGGMRHDYMRMVAGNEKIYQYFLKEK